MVALRDQEKSVSRAAESRSHLVGKMRTAFKGEAFEALSSGIHRAFRLTATLQYGVVNHTKYHSEDVIGETGEKLPAAEALEESVRLTVAIFEAIDRKLEQAAGQDWFGEIHAELIIADGKSHPIRCGAARLAKMGGSR